MQEQVNGTYIYRHKHSYIPYSTFTITKVQLHVSVIDVGHLQVVHEALNDKLYLHVSGEFMVCGVGWGGCEISFCVCRRGVDRVYLGVLLKYLSGLLLTISIGYILMMCCLILETILTWITSKF